MKKHRKRDWRRILMTFILLAICLYSAVSLIQYAVHSISTRRTNEELRAVFVAEELPEPEIPATEAAPSSAATEAAPTPAATPEPELPESYQYIGDTLLPGAEELLERNPDTVGWLYIPGGVVDLPVVYRDNTYYLDHDFYGKQSRSGTLFLDEKHPLLHDTQYLVIHGHNWHDGSMFGNLSHYRKQGYMEEHPAVYFHTLYRQEEYEVIGVLYVPGDPRSEGYVPYVGMRKFRSADQFNDFAGIIRENALHWKAGAEMRPDDALLALSTCYENDRVVVICRRTSPQ